MNKMYDELIKEVNTYGYDYKTINDLLKIGKKDKILIPVLLKWIDKFEDPRDKSWLARCLTVKGYTDATERLLNLYFEFADNKSRQWTVGNALGVIQDKRYIDEYIKIITNKENGHSRQMIVEGMGAYRDEEKVKKVLISLLDDDDVDGHAIAALSKFKDIELIKYIEPFLNHKMTWKRNEAKKAIKKLEKLRKIENE